MPLMRNLFNIASAIVAVIFLLAALVSAHEKDFLRADYYLGWAIIMISVNKSTIAGD
jgi:hypothetical protein